MNNESSWTARHDSRIDRAIDRAVREMVLLDPRAGLRRRVLARLAADTRPARASMRYAWAAAAFAIVIAVVMFARSRPTEPIGIGAPPQTAAAPAATAPAGPSNPGAPAAGLSTGRPPVDLPALPRAARRAGTSRTTREDIPMPRVGNVFGSGARGAAAAADSRSEIVWREPAAPAAEPPGAVPPLVIAPLETPTIVISPIGTASLKGGQ